MKIFTTVDDIRRYVRRYHGKKTIGFVPTMGAFHEGHLSLVRRAKKECSIVVVSLFVNPTQFGPNEDLNNYPRSFEQDKALMEKLKVDALFFPTTSEMYHDDALTSVVVEGMSERLCGSQRHNHFQGVATVVAKLFNIVMPSVAYFGEKDFQQAVVIRRMARDLNFPVEIKTSPTIREASGLALSSRNQYLNRTEREDAPLLYEAMLTVKEAYEQGERNAKELTKIAKSVLKKGKTLKVEYIEFADKDSLIQKRYVDHNTRIFLAVHAGAARLIDNMAL